MSTKYIDQMPWACDAMFLFYRDVLKWGVDDLVIVWQTVELESV